MSSNCTLLTANRWLVTIIIIITASGRSTPDMRRVNKLLPCLVSGSSSHPSRIINKPLPWFSWISSVVDSDNEPTCNSINVFKELAFATSSSLNCKNTTQENVCKSSPFAHFVHNCWLNMSCHFQGILVLKLPCNCQQLYLSKSQETFCRAVVVKESGAFLGVSLH